jgi:Mn-dependent DtxR family transcriptional regulator
MTQVSATRFSLNPSAAFLTTIYQLLEEQEVPPTRMQIYAQSGVSYQAANARLHILEREKLVTIVDHRVRLTEQGRRRAGYRGAKTPALRAASC